MSHKAVTWAWEQEGLAPVLKLVLLAMADAASDTGKSYSSNATVCRMTGLNKEETVSENQLKLIELGLISDTGKRTGSTGRIKVFQFPEAACKQSPAERGIKSPANPPRIPRLTESPYIKELGTISTPVVPKTKQAEEIYRRYPKKVGKPDALRAIRKALKAHTFELLMERTRQYAAVRASQDPEYTPHPSTWFNQERFNDDPATWKNGHSGNGRDNRSDRNSGTYNENREHLYANCATEDPPELFPAVPDPGPGS